MEKYEKIILAVIEFEREDVITVSGGNTDTGEAIYTGDE